MADAKSTTELKANIKSTTTSARARRKRPRDTEEAAPPNQNQNPSPPQQPQEHQKRRKPQRQQPQHRAPTQEQQQHEQQSEQPREQVTMAPTHLDSDDFFEVLAVERTASEAEIKKAYRKLAVQWHPDKNRSHPKAEEYFKKIAQAYEVLSDPVKRRHYERYGRVDGMANDQAENHHEFMGGGGFTSRHARDIFEAFFNGVDPFEEFFSGNPRRSSGGRGSSFGFGSAFGHGAFGGGFGGGLFGDFGFGGGGGGMMESFFSSDTGGFGGAGFSGVSQSVSSSSYTDRNGSVVTKKTTTTTDANGETKTITEEFKNGQLVNSTTSVSNRLADAGRMQLENGARDKEPSRQGVQQRGHISSGRSRGRL